jgi:predicted RNase H-like HicB family nuclease
LPGFIIEGETENEALENIKGAIALKPLFALQ